MTESLSYFEELSRRPGFQRTTFIILLNKVDLFDNIGQYIPKVNDSLNYTASSYIETVCQYFAMQFIALDGRREGEVRIYVTSAIDRTKFRETMQEIGPVLTRNGRRGQKQEGKTATSAVERSNEALEITVQTEITKESQVVKRDVDDINPFLVESWCWWSPLHQA